MQCFDFNVQLSDVEGAFDALDAFLSRWRCRSRVVAVNVGAANADAKAEAEAEAEAKTGVEVEPDLVRFHTIQCFHFSTEFAKI